MRDFEYLAHKGFDGLNYMIKLNPSQEKAVLHGNGPLLIVAGAGTGKTTVLVEKVKRLVTVEKINPYNIFITTFTDKAAEELESRLDTVMPFGYREPWLGTFHSVCERILRQEALEIGVNPNFTVMSKTDTWLFIKSHLFDFDLKYYRPLGNPTKFISALSDFFGALGDEDVNIEEFDKLCEARSTKCEEEDEIKEVERLRELSLAYTTYQTIKRNDKKVDFNDLIALTLKLFRSRPNVLKRYREQFKYMLVDEFQDTNIAQFEMIKLLSPPEANPNLTVVGDDNQSVYKFRSASISNILQFKDFYPKAMSVVLNDNFRSNQDILDSSYRLIANNNPNTLESKLNISKQLISHKTLKSRPKAIEFENHEAEVEWILKEIVRLNFEEEVPFGQMAILARANSHLDDFVEALKIANLPFLRVTNGGLYDQEVVSQLILWLRVLIDPKIDMNLYSWLMTRKEYDNSTAVLDNLNRAKNTGKTLWEVIETEENFVDAVAYVNKYRGKISDQKTSKILYDYVNESGHLQKLIETESVENLLAIKNLNNLFGIIKRYETLERESNLISFMQILDEWMEAGENPGQAQIEDVDAIRLMTVHKSKGLEFEAVFIVSVMAGRFPGNDRKQKIAVPDELVKETLAATDEHIEEERRLMYVAMTRAKQYLNLTWTPNMGTNKKWKMSGFILESGLESLKYSDEEALLRVQNAKSPHNSEANSRLNIEHSPQTPLQLSFSKIDTFEACPLRYKYKYILRIPEIETSSASYGNIIHQVLLEYHTAKMKNIPINHTDVVKNFSNLIEESNIETKIKSERLIKGTDAINKYLNDGGSFKGSPEFLEIPFKLKIGTSTLVGKIDRIDKLSDGTYEIIDYKTSEVKDQKEVDNNYQLTIYALAARDVFKLNISRLGLFFFDEQKAVFTKRSERRLANMEEKLFKIVDEVSGSTFPANPSEHHCNWCEYKNICKFRFRK